MSRKPFHNWEIKHNLHNNKSIDGFQYWNYMRRDMIMSFGDEYAGVEPPFYASMKDQGKRGLSFICNKIGKLFLNDGIKDLKKNDYLFLCHTRRQNIDGKMVSIYTDYIADAFPGSNSIQRNGLGIYPAKDIYSNNLAFLDKTATCSYIYRYFRKFFTPMAYKRIRDQIRCEMDEPFKDLSENYGLNPDPDDFADRAAILYFLYKFRFPRYKKLLRELSPRVLVEVVGLSFDAMIFNEAALSLGIETVELQHGTGPLTIWYPDNTEIRQFPKWFFSFGDFWSHSTKLPIPEDHVISTGFPYHDIMMRDYPPEKRAVDKNTVIFLSSRKYGREFAELAATLKKLRPQTHIIFKLHPREYKDYKERYPALKESGLEVIDDNKEPLYKLFARSSMQVGVESTAIYEGMSFSLTTFIWDIPKAVLMEDMVKKGYALLFKDAGELSRLIDERDPKTASFDANDFWKEGSMENNIAAIKRLAGYPEQSRT